MKCNQKKLANYAIVIFVSFILWVKGVISAEKHNIVGWLGLWNSSMVEWAENENRLHELCPKSMNEKDRNGCKQAHVEPKTWVVPTFLEPSTEAADVGQMLIEITPGRSFKITYQPNEKKQAISFTPDLYDQDWGYGPYFHQTMLEVNGDWVLLPRHPFPRPVWINVSKYIGEKNILTLQVGSIYWFNKEKVIIVEKTQKGVFLRPEQPADMWCESGNAPAIKKVKPSWVRNELLYDRNGHLKLTVAYTRGC